MCPRICAFLYTCKQELVILGWMKTDALEGVRACEEDVYLVVARKPWRRRARYLASLSTPVCSATSPGPPTSSNSSNAMLQYAAEASTL